jgi:hypothetical protein
MKNQVFQADPNIVFEISWLKRDEDGEVVLVEKSLPIPDKPIEELSAIAQLKLGMRGITGYQIVRLDNGRPVEDRVPPK